jgi:hypothetical protein
MTMTQYEMATWDAGTFEIMMTQARTSAALDGLINSVHRAVRDRKRGSVWGYTHEEAIRGLAETTDPGASTLLAQIDQARAVIAQLGDQISQREAVWEANGCWSRYFPCNNPDGHIHRSLRGCPTVRWETSMGWAVEMSGLTADEAIHGIEGQFEGLGETLCSVCFPDAPAEWCRTRSEVTRAEREAARAAKTAARDAANAVKNLDRPFRTHDRDKVTTVAAAKAVVRKAAESQVELEWSRSEDARKRWGGDQERLNEYIARAELRLAAERADAAEVNEILIAREAAAPGTGWTREDADKAIAGAVKRTRKAYFG